MPQTTLPIPMLATYDAKQDRVILTIDKHHATDDTPDNLYITVKKDTPSDAALRAKMKKRGIINTTAGQHPTLQSMTGHQLIKPAHARILTLLAESPHDNSIFIVADKPTTALNLIAILNATTARVNNALRVASVGKQANPPHTNTGLTHIDHMTVDASPWQDARDHDGRPPRIEDNNVLVDESGTSALFTAGWATRIHPDLLILEVDQNLEPNPTRVARTPPQTGQTTYAWSAIAADDQRQKFYENYLYALQNTPIMRDSYGTIVEVEANHRGVIRVTRLDMV